MANVDFFDLFVGRKTNMMQSSWPNSAGKARCPCTSQASTSNSALSPCGIGAIQDASERVRDPVRAGVWMAAPLTSQCAVAAPGCRRSVAWARRRQRRSARPITPEPSAASCSLRQAVIDRRATFFWHGTKIIDVAVTSLATTRSSGGHFQPDRNPLQPLRRLVRRWPVSQIVRGPRALKVSR